MVNRSNHYRMVGTDSEYCGGGRHGVGGREMGKPPEARGQLAHHTAPLHLLRQHNSSQYQFLLEYMNYIYLKKKTSLGNFIHHLTIYV